MKIFWGPSGTSGLGYENAFVKCKELSLHALEVAFTYGVRMSVPDAKKFGKLAKKNNVRLSIHAPYYINLASKDEIKLKASKERILRSCERAHHLGASHVVFHAGFYQGRDDNIVFNLIKDEILDLRDSIKENSWKVKLAPETTGKKSQFSGIDDLLKMKKETGCDICIDFAHLYARNQGKVDFVEVLKKVKSHNHLHCHFSGINFGDKGERNHIPLEKPFFMNLANAIKEVKPKSMTIICEAPNPFQDVLNMVEWFK